MITILTHFSAHTNANSLSYYKFYIYSYLQNNFPFFALLIILQNTILYFEFII